MIADLSPNNGEYKRTAPSHNTTSLSFLRALFVGKTAVSG